MSEAATAEHGLIGALQTTPMISTDGFVDGFCFPRFDSPNVFGALPDEKRGEHSRGRRSGRPASHAEPGRHPQAMSHRTLLEAAVSITAARQFRTVALGAVRM